MQGKSVVLVGSVVLALSFAAHTAHAQIEGYQPPLCQLNTGHFLIKNSTMYLKGATEEEDSTKVQEMLNDARENLLKAIEGDQADNPAAWYFLGRYYYMIEDGVGADSAFGRAERLAPDCETDISMYRRALWASLINAGIDSLNAGSYEHAKRLIGGAATIFEADNYGYYYLGVVHYNLGVYDSAQHYFKEAVRVGAIDSTRQQNIEAATFNVGVLYVESGELDSAAAWYERYRALKPDDAQAVIGLATIYRELGQMDRALAMYDTALARPDSLTEMQIFQAGQDVFHAENHQLATRAFELFLARNPFHRDGLYNLTNSYLAIAQKQGEGTPERAETAQEMEGVARRLVGVEPLGHEALRLLAASFALRDLEDSTRAVLQRVDKQALSIEVFRADATDSSMVVMGTISNMKDTTTEVPTIRFDFLDDQGNILASEALPIAKLDAHANQDFELRGTAASIAAWRYTVGT